MDRAAGARDQSAGDIRRPFPKWPGDIVVVAASGPSQRQEDIDEARGKARLIVINETWRLAPWADALYACDGRWWRARGPAPEAFGGLRFQGHVTREEQQVEPGCIHCGVTSGRNAMDFGGRVLAGGGNSGFQALNLAAVTGARRVVLLGYDMALAEGATHWHGDHGHGMSNPSIGFLRNSARILDQQAPVLRRAGVEVLNATRTTALTAFRRVTIKEALA